MAAAFYWLVTFLLGGIPALILRRRGLSVWGAVWRTHALWWGGFFALIALDAWGAQHGWGGGPRGMTLVDVSLVWILLGVPLVVWLWPRLARRQTASTGRERVRALPAEDAGVAWVGRVMQESPSGRDDAAPRTVVAEPTGGAWCPACGAPAAAGDNFCAECGRKLV